MSPTVSTSAATATPAATTDPAPGAGHPAGPALTLRRTLTLRSLVLFGLAYMTPIIVLGIFGIVAETTGGASPSSYLIATVAMLFTAASYGRMSRQLPVAGSAYTYVRRAIDGRVGFLVGWAVLLDYLFLPMVIWLIGASYLNAQFPAVPTPVWVALFVVLTTVLNVVGLKVADRVNGLLMAFQVLVIALFVILCAVSVVRSHGAGGLLSSAPFTGDGLGFGAIVSGAAVAAYCFLGFDAVTTLTEETIEPQRTVPRAILLVAGVGGVVFVVVSYVTTLVHPGGTFADSSSAASDIAKVIGGNLFSAVFLAGLVLAQLASGVAAQAGASRLLYAMGRDGVLPRRVFATLSRRFRTPVTSILVTGAVGLVALFLDVATSTSFVNFGAFIAFTTVNLSVVAMYLRRRAAGQTPGSVLLDVVLPVIGAVICVYLLVALDSTARTLGLVWLGIGIVVLGVLTRGYRRQPPEYVEETDDVVVEEEVAA